MSAGEGTADAGGRQTEESGGETTDMATKAAVNKLLAETPRLLVCEVCEKDFQSPQRLPRVLPCHHAFCDPCLEELRQDNHIECRHCHRRITVEGSLPVETTRMILLGLKKITVDQEDPECEVCSKKVKVIARCLECEQSLCEDCCQSHKKVKATRNHSLVSLAEAATDPSKLLQLKEKCGKHKEKKLKFYCTQCEKIACSLCIGELHNEHKIKDLQSILETTRKEMNTQCQRLKDAMPTFQTSVDSSSHRLQQFDARQQEISNKVEEMFTEAEKVLKEKKEQMLSKLEAMASEDKQVFEDQQTSDQSLLSEAQATLEFGERILLLGKPTQLICGPQDIARTCDDLEKRSTTTTNPDPDYEVVGGIEVLTETLNKMVDIKRKAVNKMVDIKRKAVDDVANDLSSSGKRKNSADDRKKTPISQSTHEPSSQQPNESPVQDGHQLCPSPKHRLTRAQNLADESEKNPPAQSAPGTVRQQLNTENPNQPDVEAGVVDSSRHISSHAKSALHCVEILLLPRGGGNFQAHLDSVGASLMNVLKRNFDVHFQTWGQGQRTPDLPVLIVYQSQGRPGDEFPGALPEEFRNSSQRSVVAFIQDDEITTAGKDIIPGNVHLVGVVNIHVIPMQNCLHTDGSTLCTRNHEAVWTIAQLLKLEAKAPNTPTQKSSSWYSGLFSREVKETVASAAVVPVAFLTLPRSSGSFKKHLDDVALNLVQELQQQAKQARFVRWDQGKMSRSSIALVVFQSQGSPGVEFLGAVQELGGTSKGVVVVVIQDDEVSTAGRDIVPKDVNLIAVLNVHVIPMQHQLHRQGSSLCARNQQAVKQIAHFLSS